MKTRNTEHRLLKSVTSIVKKILVKYLKGKNKINKSVYSIDVYQINENKKKKLKRKKKNPRNAAILVKTNGWEKRRL